MLWLGTLVLLLSPPAPAASASAAGECTFTLSPGSGNFPGAPSRGTFIVVTQPGCAWTATASDPWLTVEIGKGVGSGAVVFSVSTNPGGGNRTSSITVASR